MHCNYPTQRNLTCFRPSLSARWAMRRNCNVTAPLALLLPSLLLLLALLPARLDSGVLSFGDWRSCIFVKNSGFNFLVSSSWIEYTFSDTYVDHHHTQFHKLPIKIIVIIQQFPVIVLFFLLFLKSYNDFFLWNYRMHNGYSNVKRKSEETTKPAISETTPTSNATTPSSPQPDTDNIFMAERHQNGNGHSVSVRLF